MEELQKKELKKLYCDVCKRYYKINYFYTHKSQSRKHLKNIKLKEEEQTLLKPNKLTNDNHIKIFLNDIINKINIYLEKL
jgi:predicted protein tyrosine phosphatase